MTLAEFEEKIKDIPRVKIVSSPTPVRHLKKLSSKLSVEVWLKDDSKTSEIYGGNKPRKFEFIIGEALYKRCTELVTVGGTGTHHGIACVRFGREFGFRSTLFLFTQFETAHSRKNYHILLKEAHRIILSSGPVRAYLKAGIYSAFKKGVYFVQPGGSSPAGTLGYVIAGLELREQVASGDLPEPEMVFVPAGSLGTACGLALGFSLAGISTTVTAVRVVDAYVVNGILFRSLINRTSKLLKRCDIKVTSPDNWKIEHAFFGGRYGKPIQEGEEAISLFRELEGVKLEPVYTGKAAAALLYYARMKKIKGPILFWNTYAGE